MRSEQRVLQTGTSTTTIYPFKWYSVASSTGSGAQFATTTEYIFNNEALVSTVDQQFASGVATGSPQTSFIHPDHLGSTNVVSNASGTPILTKDYYPFGSVRVNSGSASLARGYIGQFTDQSNLSYLQNRYMESSRGQFLSQDPAFWSLSQNLTNPQSFNAYSYAENNPIALKDAAGKAAYYFSNGTVYNGNDTWNKGSYYQRSDNAMTQRNAGSMQSAQPASSVTGLAQFVNNVRPGGNWDFKNTANPQDGGRGYYFFGDQLFSAEDFGNIHFGYVGTAGGFSSSALRAGAGAAQIYSGNSSVGSYKSYFDDPKDQGYIQYGINIFNRYFTTPSGAIVTGGGILVQGPQTSQSSGGGGGGGGSGPGGQLFTTPSGAIVNAATGALVQGPPPNWSH